MKNLAKGKEAAEPDSEQPSKSQRRRDALEVRALAARLIALPPPVLAGLPLDDELRSAIGQARAIRSNGARKRQMQFVAKLMRREDPEPIREALAGLEAGARQQTARQHRAEAWRDRLVAEGDQALTELLAQRPEADAQPLRQLIRRAAREADANKPPAAARALFRRLRELDESEPLPVPGPER